MYYSITKISITLFIVALIYFWINKFDNVDFCWRIYKLYCLRFKELIFIYMKLRKFYCSNYCSIW